MKNVCPPFSVELLPSALEFKKMIAQYYYLFFQNVETFLGVIVLAIISYFLNRERKKAMRNLWRK